MATRGVPGAQRGPLRPRVCKVNPEQVSGDVEAEGGRFKVEVQGQGRPSKVRLRGQGDQEGSGGWVQRREGEQRRGTKKTKGPGLGAGENRTEGHEGRGQRDTRANRARPATRTGTTRVPALHPSVHAGAPHTGGHEENKKPYPSLRERHPQRASPHQGGKGAPRTPRTPGDTRNTQRGPHHQGGEPTPLHDTTRSKGHPCTVTNGGSQASPIHPHPLIHLVGARDFADPLVFPATLPTSALPRSLCLRSVGSQGSSRGAGGGCGCSVGCLGCWELVR